MTGNLHFLRRGISRIKPVHTRTKYGQQVLNQDSPKNLELPAQLF
jgi:hypothetical protein